MPQPRFLRIEWSATAERQLAATYVRATRTGVLPAADASPVTRLQIIEDVTEFERLCHEDWARHRDVLIGEQNPNKSPRTIIYGSSIAWMRYACRFDQKRGWLVVDAIRM